jgi:hypothetical protein
VAKKKPAVAKVAKPPLRKNLRSRKVVVGVEQSATRSEGGKKEGKEGPKSEHWRNARRGDRGQHSARPICCDKEKEGGQEGQERREESQADERDANLHENYSGRDEKGEDEDEEDEEDESEEEDKERNRGKKETRAATLLELKRGEKDLLKRAKEEDDVKKLLCAGSEVEESSGSWRQLVTKSTVSEVLVRLDLAHREEDLIEPDVEGRIEISVVLECFGRASDEVDTTFWMGRGRGRKLKTVVEGVDAKINNHQERFQSEANTGKR